MSSRSAREDNQLLLDVIVPIGVLGALAGIVIASQHLKPDSNILANRPEAIRFSPLKAPLLLQPPLYPIVNSPACGRGLTYQRNSCYIDSVLVALFTIPNKKLADTSCFIIIHASSTMRSLLVFLALTVAQM